MTSKWKGIEIIKKTNPIATKSMLAVSGQHVFYGVVIKTNGSDNATLNIYDSLTAAGTTILPPDIIVLGSARLTTIAFDKPFVVHNGGFVDITCSGAVSWQYLYDN
jgi:hypothetical protein